MNDAKKGVLGIVPDGVYFVGAGRTSAAVMGALMIGPVPVGPSSLIAPIATGWYRPFPFPVPLRDIFDYAKRET